MEAKAHDDKEAEIRGLRELVDAQDREIADLKAQLTQAVPKLHLAQEVNGFISGCRLYGVTLLSHSELGISTLHRDLNKEFSPDAADLIKSKTVGIESLRLSSTDREKIRVAIQHYHEGK